MGDKRPETRQRLLRPNISLKAFRYVRNVAGAACGRRKSCQLVRRDVNHTLLLCRREADVLCSTREEEYQRRVFTVFQVAERTLLQLFFFHPGVVEAPSACGCCCVSPVSAWLKVMDRLQSETITVFPVP